MGQRVPQVTRFSNRAILGSTLWAGRMRRFPGCNPMLEGAGVMLVGMDIGGVGRSLRCRLSVGSHFEWLGSSLEERSCSDVYTWIKTRAGNLSAPAVL